MCGGADIDTGLPYKAVKLKLDGVGSRGRAALRVDADGAWSEIEHRGERKTRIDVVQAENSRLNASLHSARKLLGHLDRCSALEVARSEAARAVKVARELQLKAEHRANSRRSTVKQQEAEVAQLNEKFESAVAAEATARQAQSKCESEARGQLAELLRLRRASSSNSKRTAELKERCSAREGDLMAQLAALEQTRAGERLEHVHVSSQLEEVTATLAGLQEAWEEQERELKLLRTHDVDFDFVAEAVGMASGGRSLPERNFADCDSSTSWTTWVSRTVRHISAVLRGRSPPLIARALVALGIERGGKGAALSVVRELGATPSFSQLLKETAQRTVELTQDHWTARLSVHLQTRLDLSRDGMDRLRHLLSFIYCPVADSYMPIKVWVNPTDTTDCVETAQLVGRTLREREYKVIADSCGVAVCANTGRCERDTKRVSEQMYDKYALAMRTNFSETRPAQPVFYIDATGSGLGRAG